MNYNPILLAAIDEIDIVNLENIRVDCVSDFMRTADHAPFVKLSGSLAQHVATLWRQLPAGEPDRCHIPSFGLRFFNENELIVQGSISWKCSNIFGDAKGVNIVYAFHAQGDISQQLLKVCEESFQEINLN